MKKHARRNLAITDRHVCVVLQHLIMPYLYDESNVASTSGNIFGAKAAGNVPLGILLRSAAFAGGTI
jgi:hypothetical protein